MAVHRPKMPKGYKKPKAVVPDAPIYNPPSHKRMKGIEQTQAPRTRGANEAGFGAQAPAIRAVRQRGSFFGQYVDELDEPGSYFQTPQDQEDGGFIGSDGRMPQIDPTPSSNPPKPRTLRAGYIKERGAGEGTLWVVFRDGTPWEYYDVPQNVWRNFRRVKSPGRFINRVLNNYDYGRGDF